MLQPWRDDRRRVGAFGLDSARAGLAMSAAVATTAMEAAASVEAAAIATTPTVTTTAIAATTIAVATTAVAVTTATITVAATIIAVAPTVIASAVAKANPYSAVSVGITIGIAIGITVGVIRVRCGSVGDWRRIGLRLFRLTNARVVSRLGVGIAIIGNLAVVAIVLVV